MTTTFEDIQEGTSWACTYETHYFVDDRGARITQVDIAPGEAHPGEIRRFTGVGIIQIRDVENRRVQLFDPETGETHMLPWEACSRIEPIEWIDNDNKQ